MMRRVLLTMACMAVLTGALAGATPALAQGLNARPIQFLIPYPPGGGGDTLGRLVAQKLADVAGTSVVVENKPGAGGMIGTEAAARAPGDGYTLMLGTPSPLTVVPSMLKKMPYDVARDLAPVTLITILPGVVLVNNAVPANSLPELIALARAKPGKLNYGSSGNGGSGHLSGLMLANMANLQMVHVPYKGTGPALTALMGGEIEVFMSDMTAALPQIRANRVRALAVTSKERSSALPNVPAVGETVTGFAAGPFYGILAPGTTPREIVQRRRNEIVQVLNLPDVKARIQRDGGEVIGSTPDEFSSLIKAETARWAQVLKDANFKIE